MNNIVKNAGWKQIVFFCFLPLILSGQISLPPVFSDHMVLQRQMPVPVWGKASPGSIIRIRLADMEVDTEVDREGNWKAEFPAMKAGGPYELVVQSQEEKLIIKDVLIGEVWLCSGQSNMAFPVDQSAQGKATLQYADRPLLRLFNMQPAIPMGNRVLKVEEVDQIDQGKFFAQRGWEASTPESAGAFSAVAFYFGMELLDSLQVPVGLIHNAVGGSPIQSWVSRNALMAHPQLKSFVQYKAGKNWMNLPGIHPWLRQRAALHLSSWVKERPGEAIPGHPFAPAYLFRSGIRPLAPFALRGVLWYQGESNATHPDTYPALFEQMLLSWRTVMERPELPVYFVQLPRISNRSRWPEFREAQENCLAVDHTGMVVTIDQGDPTDVHPKEKKEIGSRLARLILKDVHHRDILAHSPSLAGFKWKEEEGAIVLEFDHAGGRLRTSNEAFPEGFLLQGYEAGGRRLQFFQPREIQLRKNEIHMEFPERVLITTIYYAWAPFPVNNIVNRAGLPLRPFRLELSGNN